MKNCRWDAEDSSEFTYLYHTDCGRYKQESFPKYLNFKFCPFCGLPIDLGEKPSMPKEPTPISVSRLTAHSAALLEFSHVLDDIEEHAKHGEITSNPEILQQAIRLMLNDAREYAITVRNALKPE